MLKGPQGTLFGRNATAGVVQVTTRTPGDTLGAEASVSYANYDTLSGTAYLGGPISETLKADLSFYGERQGRGWGRNLTTGQDEFKVNHDYLVRSKWVFTPIETARFTVIGDYSDSSARSIGLGLLPGTLTTYAPGVVQPDLGRYNLTTNAPNFKKGWSAGVSFQYEQDIGSLKLTTLSAYRQSRYEVAFDYDFSAANIQDINYVQPDCQFSQEIQIQPLHPGRLQWVIGGYYFVARSAYEPFRLNHYAGGASVRTFDYQKTRSPAVFVQGSYELLPQTNLTLGLRYTHEKRDLYDGSTAIIFGGPTAPPAFTVPGSDTRATFNKVTFRVALDHRFSPNALAYASMNRGFKSGGFNTSSPGSAPFGPETIDAYEFGIKTDLLDRRLRVNAAAFYYSYSDLQVTRLEAAILLITNAASARVYGLDVDFEARITNDLRLSGGATLTDAKFRSFPSTLIGAAGGGSPSTLGSASGNRLPLSSKYTVSVGANYEREVSFGRLSLATNIYYNGGFFFEADNHLKQGAFAQLSAALGWASAGGKYSVDIFGKNLTDARILSVASTEPGTGSLIGTYAEPRTYGVTFKVKI